MKSSISISELPIAKYSPLAVTSFNFTFLQFQSFSDASGILIFFREILLQRLDKGLYDFAVVWDPSDISNYESVQIPYNDSISILMPADCKLAQKEEITLKDLTDIPIIMSRHQKENHIFQTIFKQEGIKLNIVATYNLIFNASIMVEEGMGYAIGFDNIIDTTGDRNLVCRPLIPLTKLHMNLIWKKYQVFSKASQLYLEKIYALIEKVSTEVNT